MAPKSAVEVMAEATVKRVEALNRVSMASKGRTGRETYRRNDGSDKAAPSREDGEDTNYNLCRGNEESNGVSCKHPPSDLLVGLHGAANLVVELLLHICVVQAPHLDRVEMEARLARGAVCDLSLFAVRLVDIAFAVVPDMDIVEVFQVTGGRIAD